LVSVRKAYRLPAAGPAARSAALSIEVAHRPEPEPGTADGRTAPAGRDGDGRAGGAPSGDEDVPGEEICGGVGVLPLERPVQAVSRQRAVSTPPTAVTFLTRILLGRHPYRQARSHLSALFPRAGVGHTWRVQP
jgi:hypothetical protein